MSISPVFRWCNATRCNIYVTFALFFLVATIILFFFIFYLLERISERFLERSLRRSGRSGAERRAERIDFLRNGARNGATKICRSEFRSGANRFAGAEHPCIIVNAREYSNKKRLCSMCCAICQIRTKRRRRSTLHLNFSSWRV